MRPGLAKAPRIKKGSGQDSEEGPQVPKSLFQAASHRGS